MSKTTRKLMLFIAFFSIISAMGALGYKMIYNVNMPWFVIIGGILSGFILTYLVKTYDSDDDFMPKKKN